MTIKNWSHNQSHKTRSGENKIVQVGSRSGRINQSQSIQRHCDELNSASACNGVLVSDAVLSGIRTLFSHL